MIRDLNGLTDAAIGRVPLHRRCRWGLVDCPIAMFALEFCGECEVYVSWERFRRQFTENVRAAEERGDEA